MPAATRVRRAAPSTFRRVRSSSPATVRTAAGALRVGEHAPAAMIAVHVPVAATGGAGNDVGGMGGTVTPEPGAGNVNVAGNAAIDVSGGDSLTMPGTGGLINGGPRTDPGS